MSSPRSGETIATQAGDDPVPAQRKTEVLVRRLGELRDGLLLLAGVLYLLGYTSWALYALDTGIGLVPVLDSQYFASGIVPAVILLLFALSVRLLRNFQKWLKRPLSAKYQIMRPALGWIAAALVLVFIALKLVLKGSPAWLSWFIPGYMIFMLVSAFFGREKGDRFFQGMGLFLIWSYTILGALWLIVGYDLKIFPQLPSELGGPKPRCAQLDIDASQLSPETRAQLLGNLALGNNSSVFRSVPLYLIFDGSEYMLLSERAEPPSRTNTVYRLRKEAVKAVFPCPTSVSGAGPR